MSTLAFNKEGEPFSFDNRTHQLRLRRFRKPGARGTCEAVLDADGDQVYIDVDADYAELRRAVDNVTGFYRLDQCDEDGRPIADLPAAYVSVEAVRNAGLSGDADAMTVVRELAAINAEVAKTMADRFAAVMQSTAEILRAADGAGIAHRKPVLEIASDEDDKDEIDDDDDDAPDSAPPTALESIATILQAVQPMLDTAMALYTQLKANAAQAGAPGAAHATPPAAATASESEPASVPPSTASPSSGSVPDGAAAGSSGAASASATTTEKQTAKGASATPATPPSSASAASSETARRVPTAAKPPASSVSAPASETSASTTVQPSEAPATAVRNASLAPTMQQVAHLTAIRARLTPKEAAIAERVMKQMTPDMLGQWLVALSEQSVDEAVQTIRKTVASIELAQRNTPGDGKRG
jgi:hypothetical protein